MRSLRGLARGTLRQPQAGYGRLRPKCESDRIPALDPPLRPRVVALIGTRRSPSRSFGETLMPVMARLGADPGEPQVAEVHNIMVG